MQLSQSEWEHNRGKSYCAPIFDAQINKLLQDAWSFYYRLYRIGYNPIRSYELILSKQSVPDWEEDLTKVRSLFFSMIDLSKRNAELFGGRRREIADAIASHFISMMEYTCYVKCFNTLCDLYFGNGPLIRR